MRSLIVGISAVIAAAMPFIACAEQKTVPAGTTVTVQGADILSWASADIDIGAGATLCLSEPSNHATFTGNITGSGNFVAKFASSSETPKVFTMNGNATGFTGAFFYSNVYVWVMSPQSVGNVAPITIRVGYTGPTSLQSMFYGSNEGQPDYVYQNALDVSVQINASALAVNERAVLAGSVLHRDGALKGPGKITGNITTLTSCLVLSNGIHVEGACSTEVAGAYITNLGSSLYFGGKTEGFSRFVVFNCNTPVYLEGDNLFGENVVLQLGENSSGAGHYSGLLDLNGHSQVFKRAWFKMDDGTPDETRNIGGIINSGKHATLTFANNDTAKWFYGRIGGHLSLCISGTQLFGFTGSVTNTIDGTITSTGGSRTMQGYWPRLKGIASLNGSGINLYTGDINPRLGALDIDSTSTVNVKNGVTVNVRRFRIDGVEMPIGRYDRYTSGPTYNRIVFGTGAINVTGVPGGMLIIK